MPSTPCTACGTGTYAGEAQTSCHVCVRGTADSDTDASTPCDTCGVGHYSGGGSTGCTACAAGEHDDDLHPGTVCVGCVEGTYSDVGSMVCTVCGEVEEYEPETVKEWFKYQDSSEHKSAPYKYSRTTHFRNSLDRILGNSRVDSGVVERARMLLKGYPDDHACMLTILRQAKMPYQQTASIRRALGYSVPQLTATEKRDINNLFEYFCVRYEILKPADRKNLPSIEYMIFRFLLHLGRDDIFVRKSSLTPAKQKETDDLIDRILRDFELQELH